MTHCSPCVYLSLLTSVMVFRVDFFRHANSNLLNDQVTRSTGNERWRVARLPRGELDIHGEKEGWIDSSFDRKSVFVGENNSVRDYSVSSCRTTKIVCIIATEGGYSERWSMTSLGHVLQWACLVIHISILNIVVAPVLVNLKVLGNFSRSQRIFDRNLIFARWFLRIKLNGKLLIESRLNVVRSQKMLPPLSFHKIILDLFLP